jgi:hypothetical protein
MDVPYNDAGKGLGYVQMVREMERGFMRKNINHP